MRIRILLFSVLSLFIVSQSFAQAIWEDTRSMIYPYLTRMADKGLIELDDIIQPITQTKILTALYILLTKERM